jgi:hypothetical protein
VRALFHGEPEAPDTQVGDRLDGALHAASPTRRESGSSSFPAASPSRCSTAPPSSPRRRTPRSSGPARAWTSPSTSTARPRSAWSARPTSGPRPSAWRTRSCAAPCQFGFRPDELQGGGGRLPQRPRAGAEVRLDPRSDELAGRPRREPRRPRGLHEPGRRPRALRPRPGKGHARRLPRGLRRPGRRPAGTSSSPGNAKIGRRRERAVAAAYAPRRRSPSGPRTRSRRSSWAYGDFGPPGAVASRTHVDDLDITEVTFANGVRLNLKKTDFEANTIHVAARLGTGQL